MKIAELGLGILILVVVAMLLYGAIEVVGHAWRAIP